MAALGILVVGAHAASAGTYEICKSGANGMAGKQFKFTVTTNLGTVKTHFITPVGSATPTCTAPQTIGGTLDTSATIVESDVAPTVSEVASITVIPSARELSRNVPNKTVQVNLGTSTANETQVRFVNQPLNGTSGTLKICKLTQTSAFVGHQFSFSVGPTLGNQGPLVSTIANDFNDDPANWSCRILGTFQVNSVVFVKEQIPANVRVDFIDTDPGSNLVDFDKDQGWAQVRVGTGTTLVLFDDEPIPPAGNGFLEICKNPPGNQDPAVTGSWHFTVTDQNGDPVPITDEFGSPVIGGVDVLTNQCSPRLTVPAGILTVTETARAGFQLTDVFTIPTDALVNSNIINRTADVEVPTSSDPADEVQVSFVNKPITSQLKVCKALGPNSSVLAGQRFYFSVTNITDPTNPVPLAPISVIAPGCKVFGTLPTGTVVRVDEVSGPDDPTTTQDDSNTAFITTTSPATTTIGPGTTNTVTITNTAFGQIEICKDPVDGITKPPTFQFRIDTGGIISVPAGGCSDARNVSVGSHTVTELNPGDYELTAITVSPSGRLVGTPDLANRTVTVSVPYGTDGETVTTFTNRIKQGRFKVCKTIPLTSLNSLGGKTFNYLLYIQTGGTHAAPIFNGGGPGVPLTVAASTDPNSLTTCSGFTGYFPILQANGERTIAAVQEQLTGGFVVDSITVSPNNGLCSFGTGLPTGASTSPSCVGGGVDKAGDPANHGTPGFAEIDWFLSGGTLGNAQVTFTNRSTTT